MNNNSTGSSCLEFLRDNSIFFEILESIGVLNMQSELCEIFI